MSSHLRCKLHRNLNAKNGAIEWSFTPLIEPYKNLVAAYAREAVIKNVEFRVQPAGIRRIRQEQCKTVVAWVVGELTSVTWARNRLFDEMPIIDAFDDNSLNQLTLVRFNPYIDELFFCADSGKTILAAEWVVLDAQGQCWAYNTTS